jgi:hypothetical protein
VARPPPVPQARSGAAASDLSPHPVANADRLQGSSRDRNPLLWIPICAQSGIGY